MSSVCIERTRRYFGVKMLIKIREQRIARVAPRAIQRLVPRHVLTSRDMAGGRGTGHTPNGMHYATRLLSVKGRQRRVRRKCLTHERGLARPVT